ncbi:MULTISPECIES: GNAT family N-acetyltransferase [unclassified Actinotalea]|uniref:GNAT family N-acetyltransferase n=1 Tax=unclassified Actinotalea TaxID=2638618 RepID=UPI0015F67D9D|nr:MULTISPECIES: GNAT family N-acetyltransferase [unclassified Actinotalea]
MSAGTTTPSYRVRALDASTWDQFAELVERNNGIFGGCWCIGCLFVDRRHRGQGVARAALEGALAEIGRQGGGLVEAISEVTAGREAQGRFLFTGTVELFEDLGFARVRQVGKHAWIVNRRVEAR